MRDRITMVDDAGMARSQNGSASVTVHELHNLIAVIIAEAQLLQLDHPADAPDYRSAVAIERAGRRLEALIDGLTVFLGTPGTRKKLNRDHVASQSIAGRPREVVQEATEEAEA